MFGNKEALMDRFMFRGAGVPVEAGNASESPWRTSITNGGTATADAAGLKLEVPVGPAARNITLFFGDVLSYNINDLIAIEFWLQFNQLGADLANTEIAIGMASNQNDTIDSIANQVLFRAIGSTDIVLESDDGTNDNNDIVTSGVLESGEIACFSIAFDERVMTKSPGQSTGKLANFRYGIDGKKSLATQQPFDLSGITGGLQPYIQVGCTAATTGANVIVKEICVQHRLN